MKISERDKKALQFFVIILFLILTTITMFYPEKLNYKFSLKEIENKVVMANELENEVKRNEPVIEEKLLELYSLEDLSARIERKAETLKQGIKKEDLSIHMPSILISLEQNAKKNKVDLIIEYEAIETYMSNQQNIEEETSGIEEKINDEEKDKTDSSDDENIEENIEIKKEKDKSEKNETKLDSQKRENEEVTIERKENNKDTNDVHEIDKAIVKNLIPNIEGINITTVPVKIKGKYSNVREFIRYLDTIDYLEPSFVDLSSNGEEVIGAILIHVFHGEVD